MKTRIRFLSITVAVCAVLGVAACQTATPPKTTLVTTDSGYFHFPTSMPWKGRRVDIGGTLTFPKGNSAPVPLVVLVHSADGIDHSEHRWEDLYLSEGYAVFMLDYFAGRSVSKNDGDSWARTGSDVYDALKVLKTHPMIDSERVAVQGFSNGGTVTASSIVYLSANNYTPKVKAFIFTYGGCTRISDPFMKLDKVKNAGFLFLVGELDKAAGPGACKSQAETMKKDGFDAKAVIFPGVHHGFDDVETKSVSIRRGGANWEMVFRPDAEATEKSFQESKTLLKRVF